MDFKKMVRDFQHAYVERPLRSWGEHEEALVSLLKSVVSSSSTPSKRTLPMEELVPLRQSYKEATTAAEDANRRVITNRESLQQACPHPEGDIIGHNASQESYDEWTPAIRVCASCGLHLDPETYTPFTLVDSNVLKTLGTLPFLDDEHRADLISKGKLPRKIKRV